MKKIAIFAIFLMATIMTFGQLVPDEQYLPTCSVKSTSTNFTKFIPKNTTVKVGTSQYILLADGGVGNSLSKMLLLGTAEVDPCCGSTGTVSATSTTTTINNDSVIIGNGTGAIGIFPGTLTVRGLATLAGGASIAGHLFSRYDANGIQIGSSFHADTIFGNVGSFGIGVIPIINGVTNFKSAPYFSLGTGTYNYYNIGLGLNALDNTTSGTNIIAIGNQAEISNTVGTQKIAIGGLAGSMDVNGSNYVLIGDQAGRYAASLTNSIGLGSNALFQAIGGTELIAIGENACSKGGQRSVAIGSNTGGNSILNWSTLVGNSAGNTAATYLTGCIRIGNRSGGLDTTANTIYIHSADQTIVTPPDSLHAVIYAKTNPAGTNNHLNLNALTSIQKIKLPVTDTTTKISGFVNVGAHIYVGNGTYFKLLY